MENYLYLLELFVESISFTSNLPEYPRAYDVLIMGEMGEFLRLDVSSVQTSILGNEQQKDLHLNSGRSVLFSCPPGVLLQKIDANPFEISLYVKQKYIASAPIGWTKDFYTLAKTVPESVGVSGPISMQDQFLLMEKNTSKIMGDIKASVRLSCFGTNIQTSFQLISTEKDANKRYLVRGARGETTFECQKLGEGNSDEVIPLTTLFHTDQNTGNGNGFEDDRISFMALYKSSLDEKSSARPDEFNIAISNMFTSKTPSNLTFDIISLRERPEENKYIDLRIKGDTHGLVFELDASQLKTTDEDLFSQEEEIKQVPSLTEEKINELLCKSKDCPAAKKFKQLGIGPLANTKGLGGMYREPSLHVTYGLSQTYGVFDEYGPYGLFSKPKKPTDPFVPKQESDWESACWKPKRKKKDRSNALCSCQKHNYNACYCKAQDNGPLRLTGGGVLDYDDVKSPLHECKEIMDQFDEVLAKYKKALGPCGKVTCPFAPNVTKEGCKKLCTHPMDISDENVAANIAAYTPQEEEREKKKFQPKAACGSPKCAYAKYKTGLVDEDAEMELQYLPAAPSGKCGHPKCPHPVVPDLPPIHWDCPDPLPTGKCKNPNCPYLPKEIKCLNAVLAKGPCGNFNCPFSPPAPCNSPYCPFASKECPYQQQKTDSDSVCSNPDCPYAIKEENSICENPECPFASKRNDISNNPACPYALKPPCENNPCQMSPQCPYPMNPYMQNLLTYLALVTGNTEALQMCYGGPQCPYEKKEAQKEDVCSSPKCPFQSKIEKSEQPSCTKKASPCYVPVESFCGNPNCPSAKKRTSQDATSRRRKEDEKEIKEGDTEYYSETRISMDLEPCHPETCKAEGGDLVCEACPRSEGVEKENDICENAECPFAPKTCYKKQSPCYLPPKDVCSNTSCPFAPKPCGPPPCLMAVPPCSMPFPPCEVDPLQVLLAYCTPISICPDGTCPYPSKNLLQICFGGAERPYMKPPEQEPCGVEEKKGEEEICDNPDCPYKGPSGDAAGKSSAPCEEVVEGATEYKSDTRLSVDMQPCTQKTCQSTGGQFVCDDCPCTKTQSEIYQTKEKIQKATKSAPTIGGKKRKRKCKSKYVYSIGDKYPGVQIGHKECVMPGYNVPPKMGWLWNVHTPCLQLKPRRGWRPGAIAKTIAERIRKHREAQGLQMLELGDLRKGKKGYGPYESGTSINIQPKPTLHIKKQDGCYWITMNPLKDPHTLVENESPYMDCTPLQFKIMKNKDKQNEENENEYTSCFCGDEQQIESSSSDSELEIEFTPPAGIIHPERFKRKRNVVHCDTQYLETDFVTKSEKGSKKGGKGKGKKGKGKGKGKKEGKKGKKKK